jgi:hypothetical protein
MLRLKCLFVVFAFVVPGLCGAQPIAVADNTVPAIIESVSADRIESDIRTLVRFGTHRRCPPLDQG